MLRMVRVLSVQTPVYLSSLQKLSTGSDNFLTGSSIVLVDNSSFRTIGIMLLTNYIPVELHMFGISAQIYCLNSTSTGQPLKIACYSEGLCRLACQSLWRKLFFWLCFLVSIFFFVIIYILYHHSISKHLDTVEHLFHVLSL